MSKQKNMQLPTIKLTFNKNGLETAVFKTVAIKSLMNSLLAKLRCRLKVHSSKFSTMFSTRSRKRFPSNKISNLMAQKLSFVKQCLILCWLSLEPHSPKTITLVALEETYDAFLGLFVILDTTTNCKKMILPNFKSNPKLLTLSIKDFPPADFSSPIYFIGLPFPSSSSLADFFRRLLQMTYIAPSADLLTLTKKAVLLWNPSKFRHCFDCISNFYMFHNIFNNVFCCNLVHWYTCKLYWIIYW